MILRNPSRSDAALTKEEQYIISELVDVRGHGRTFRNPLAVLA
jgi:hypothetical protein